MSIIFYKDYVMICGMPTFISKVFYKSFILVYMFATS
jgi:hypothetical protein